MTPTEFQEALKALGMNARTYARLSGRNPWSVGNWTRAPWVKIPPAVEEWLLRRVREMERDPPP